MTSFDLESYLLELSVFFDGSLCKGESTVHVLVTPCGNSQIFSCKITTIRDKMNENRPGIVGGKRQTVKVQAPPPGIRSFHILSLTVS